MIRLILFIALTYCFNQSVQFVSMTDWTIDLDPISTRYYIDIFYLVLPAIALLYAKITKWVFSFNKKEVVALYNTNVTVPIKEPSILMDKVEPKRK